MDRSYAVSTTFGAMVVAEVLLGIGFAFTSGADSALLFVSLKSEDPARYRQWEGRVRAAAQASDGWGFCRSRLLSLLGSLSRAPTKVQADLTL